MTTNNPIKVHVFTDVKDVLFLKQSPAQKPISGSASFTFGVDIAEDADVLIVYNRASYTIETSLPKDRTVFLAAEPDVIHPYSCRFLNQFGLVLTTTTKELNTQKWQRSTCWHWFAGRDFSAPQDQPYSRDHDWFSTLQSPKKSDKISIVTSTKVHTEYHQKRLQFVETLIEKIPDHLEIYGRGFQSIDDKADALLPCRYHLAIENGDGPHAWTEKLADPWLCWAFPFYSGCNNVEDYFSQDSFEYVDVNNPVDEAERMVREIQNGRWEHAKTAIADARQRVLDKHNLMTLLGDLANAAFTSSPSASRQKVRKIWSERSLLPEKGCRGNLTDWALRNAILMLDPRAELKTITLRHKIIKWRSNRKSLKLRQSEQPRQ